MNNLFETIITVMGTILALVNVFQWVDKRSKNKALQSFLEAVHDIAKRLPNVSEKAAIQEKSSDICSILNAAIVTVGGGGDNRIEEKILRKKTHFLKNKNIVENTK